MKQALPAIRAALWAIPLDERLEVTETALRIDAFLPRRTAAPSGS